MPWWLWLIPIVGIFFFLWRLQPKPQYHERTSFNRLNHFVERFVRTGKVGSVMLMEQENAAGLLQLRLRENDASEVTVEIGMPEVDWSMAEFDRIAVRLGDAGFATRIGGGRGCSTVRRFLRASTSGEESAVVSNVTRGIAVVGASLGWQTSTFTVHNEMSWRSRVE